MRIYPKISAFLVLPIFVAAIETAHIAFGETAGDYIDDAAITAKIKATMIADQQLKATQVSVETDQGVVQQLSGTVDTKKEEAEALRVVNQVNGVKSIKDLLNVRESQND